MWGKKAKLYYMGTDSFTIHMETEDNYTDIAKYVETRFNASNYELDRPLPRQKYKSNLIHER